MNINNTIQVHLAADKRRYTPIKIQGRPLTYLKSFELICVHLCLSAAQWFLVLILSAFICVYLRLIVVLVPEQVLYLLRQQLAVDLAVRVARQAAVAHDYARRHHERR